MFDLDSNNQGDNVNQSINDNHALFLRQKALLDQFLSTGAISQAQHDKSLHDLAEKMNEELTSTTNITDN